MISQRTRFRSKMDAAQMKTALVVRHVAFEDLGAFAAPLAEAGYATRYHEAGRGRLDPAGADADLVILLGGPIGVYETEDYPFLRDEIELARRRLDSGAPLLGICLGCQIMAQAGGGSVFPGAAGKEIGFAPIALTADGNASALAELVTPEADVLHWHGDSWSAPPGAKQLASSGRYEAQAFSMGERALGLQFHPEVDAAALESWLIGHALEIATTPGVSVCELRAAAAQKAESLRIRGRRFFSRWLDEL
jgi:GMP synthase (glutamine-hydrolysing)